MLTIRPIISEDYETLCGFWRDWGFEPVPKQFLPQNGLGGLMVEGDGVPICGGFVYLTNSGIAWVNWIISNKQYRKKPQRKEAIELLINSLGDIAKEAGYTYLYALINNDTLVNVYEKLGYLKSASYNQELIKKI
jgi:RimJ/RimL family protein N-acetyltransferase